MTANADSGTPLWVTEFAWGSGPPDQFCKNRGLEGQRDLLVRSFDLFLSRRRDWNLSGCTGSCGVTRRPGPRTRACAASAAPRGCCGTTAPRSLPTAMWSVIRCVGSSTTRSPTVPQVNIVSGPNPGAWINDATPTFKLSVNENGAAFVCHYDTAPFISVRLTYTRTTALTNGAHAFYVEQSTPPVTRARSMTRPFTVDTIAAADDDHRRPVGARPPTAPPRSASPPASRTRPSSVASTPRRSPRARGRAAATHPLPPLAPGHHTSRSRPGTRRGTSTRRPPTRAFTVTPRTFVQRGPAQSAGCARMRFPEARPALSTLPVSVPSWMADASGKGAQGPRITRGIVFHDCPRVPARCAHGAGRALGVLRHRAGVPGREGRPGDGRRPCTDRALPIPMAVDGAEPWCLDWRQRDQLIGRLASRHVRAVPFVWGSPQWVGNGKLAQPPIASEADRQAWRNFLNAAVARYGPGGSYWSNAYLQRYGANATPLADSGPGRSGTSPT